jgi:hypothetical protein
MPPLIRPEDYAANNSRIAELNAAKLEQLRLLEAFPDDEVKLKLDAVANKLITNLRKAFTHGNDSAWTDRYHEQIDTKGGNEEYVSKAVDYVTAKISILAGQDVSDFNVRFIYLERVEQMPASQYFSISLVTSKN